jgi:hypothetical protein
MQALIIEWLASLPQDAPRCEEAANQAIAPLRGQSFHASM